MFKVGHRVYSVTEPELGLGEVEKLIENRLIQVRFDLAQQKRRYTLKGSHLLRIELKVGDHAVLRNGKRVVIAEIDKTGDFYRYNSEEVESFGEKELHPKQVFSNSKDNLIKGRWLEPKFYGLIRDTHRLKPQGDKLKAALLASSRVSLLDHQLWVAWKAAENLPVRQLLSDEVGLGKTIESGLIITLLTGLGRAKRVVITCPDALQNQWLAEVYRRFNIYVSIFPEGFETQDQAVGAADFLNTHRHVIVPWSRIPAFLSGFQTASSPFDLLILDEAHQLLSEEFLESETTGLKAIEWILSTTNCLFLTATPKFLGNETEFRLLNLLNDEEFPEYEDYVERVESLKLVDAALKEIEEKKSTSTPKLNQLLKGYADEAKLKAKPADELRTLIAEVWGYGNTVVRNRRAKLHFDIKRELVHIPLEKSKAREPSDLSAYQGLSSYPEKIAWLQTYLRDQGNKKFLIIVSSLEAATRIHRELSEKGGFRAALFHEEMDLIARDRAAEWFHDAEAGAQVLVCSEIGGEGRNFQHADGLVLFDLPLEPNLLEQRIGRLDRIGRSHSVKVLVPVVKSSPQDFLLDWYDEALEIFSHPWNGELDMNELALPQLESLLPLIEKSPAKAEAELERIVTQTREKVSAHRKSSGEALETLLDLQSLNAAKAKKIRTLCEGVVPDNFLDYLERAFDSFDIDFAQLDDDDTYSINASSLSFADDVSEFTKFEDRSLTLDRSKALARENLTYLSVEHPIVRSLSQNILQKNEGYASLALTDSIPGPLAVQVFFTLQIPPHKGWDLSAYFEDHSFEISISEGGTELKSGVVNETRIQKPKLDITQAFLTSLGQRSLPLIEQAEDLARKIAKKSREKAQNVARSELDAEIEKLKLKAFALGSDSFHEEMVTKRMTEVDLAIAQTEPRIEAIRLLINPRARADD